MADWRELLRQYGEECAVAGEMVGYKRRYDSSYVRALEAELIGAVEKAIKGADAAVIKVRAETQTDVVPQQSPCRHCYCRTVHSTTTSPGGVACCKCGDVRLTEIIP